MGRTLWEIRNATQKRPNTLGQMSFKGNKIQWRCSTKTKPHFHALMFIDVLSESGAQREEIFPLLLHLEDKQSVGQC